jgi:hypothetical protein
MGEILVLLTGSTALHILGDPLLNSGPGVHFCHLPDSLVLSGMDCEAAVISMEDVSL